MTFIRSKCNEACDWCIYVTVVTCADTMRHAIVFSSFYCLKNYYTSDICHLLISGVGVKIATDLLCESVGCHYKVHASP